MNKTNGPNEKVETKPIVKEMEPMKETKVAINLPIVIGAVIIVAAGIFTGYMLSNGGKLNRTGASISSGKTSSGLAKVVGVQDEKTFKDSAEGILREGGIDKEGTHHLERAGGESQNVYLISSNIALSDYVDKKVKVWGQTLGAEKAGWLMDVGRLELEE